MGIFSCDYCLPEDDRKGKVLDQDIVTKWKIAAGIENERQRPKVKVALRHLWIEFCRDSTLNGMMFLGRQNLPIWEKLFWLATVIFGLFLSWYFLDDLYKDYSSSNVLTIIDSSSNSIDDVKFPSITICNNDLMRKHFPESNETKSWYIKKYVLRNLVRPTKTISTVDIRMEIDRIKQEIANDTLYEEIQRISSEYRNASQNERFRLDRAMKKYFRDGSHDCTEMFINCKWKGDDIPCTMVNNREMSFNLTNNYSVIQDSATDFGFCCRIDFPALELIRMMLNPVERLKYRLDRLDTLPADSDVLTNNTKLYDEFLKLDYGPPPIGVASGLELLMDSEAYNYDFSLITSEGFQVLIHSMTDVATVYSKGFGVEPGTQTIVGVSLSQVYTTDDARSRFRPEQRSCYYSDEIETDIYVDYSIQNCYYEASLKKLANDCGCLAYYMPAEKLLTDDGTMPLLCRGLKNMTCMNYILQKEIPNFFIKDGKVLNCLASCNETSYNLQISRAKFPNYNLFRIQKYIDLICDRIAMLCSRDDFAHDKSKSQWKNDLCSAWNASSMDCSELAILNDDRVYKTIITYSQRNLAMMSIFIKDPYGSLYKRDTKMTPATLIGNAGGVIGLCIGFSFISGVEVIYFFFIRIWYLSLRKYVPKKPKKIKPKSASDKWWRIC